MTPAARPGGPHRPLILEGDVRDALRAHLLAAWGLTDWLFSGLVDDAVFDLQPDPRRNPLVFYFGHPAAFTLNKLGAAGLVDGPVDADLQRILGVGVDPATADELDRRAWPPVDEVRDLRRAALPRILAAVDAVDAPPGWDDPGWALLMGAEHERIHFETSSVLVRQLPLDAVRPPPGWTIGPSGAEPPDAARVEVPGRTVVLGKPDHPPTWGWDNEFGHLAVEVAPFTAGATLVSNRAFLGFVRAGGYRDRRWWSEAGWRWRAGRTLPPFWCGDADAPALRTVFRRIALPLDWPAEVTFHEAEAWCRWAGARLPTEAEWVAMAGDAARNHGDTAQHPDHHLHLATCSPRPVHAGRPTPTGLHDPAGNLWQWLSDDFRPLPGFRAHPLYPDFSTPYFDPEHKTLRGGSWASTGATASEHYRLWFRPDFLQHAGFRPIWPR